MSPDRRSLADVRRAAELEPTAHVRDEADLYCVDIDAPGLGEHDFLVEVTDRLLKVSGPDLRKADPEARFDFLFRLPESADANRLSASFAGGVLVVCAPKSHEETRRVEIDVSPPRG
ncbi:MAG TPA: Hsp20/alpha crystallin family protein [Gaiellaceae bacterium]|nr:Hsp20/alpha crystallin family protein [Gaiellaceae bacterium]